MPDTIPLVPDKLKDYLDGCIRLWREKKNAGHFMAMFYIDAYQSVRTSLFGETLPSDDGDKTTEELSDMIEKRLQSVLLSAGLLNPVNAVRIVMKVILNE